MTPHLTVTDYGTNDALTFTDQGDSATTTICGSRSYSITDDTGGAVDWVAVSYDSATGAGKITASPRGKDDYSDHSMLLKVSSVEYPATIGDITLAFTVCVSEDCIPTELAAPTSLATNLIFVVGTTAAPVTHEIPAWTQTPCLYTEELVVTPDTT